MANRGEWSEFYAFLKLLADGQVKCVDGHLVPNGHNHIIEQIFRDDNFNRNTYDIDINNNQVIINQGQTNASSISCALIANEARTLWNFIQTLQGSGTCQHTVNFMPSIFCDPGKITAKSTDKADIRLVIHHYVMGKTPEQGYSIKSSAGAPSTLVNASKDHTNFIYELPNLTLNQLQIFSQQKNFVNKFAQANISSLEYRELASSIMKMNLRILDGDLEVLLAECLRVKYMTGKTKIKDIIPDVINTNPLNLSFQPNSVVSNAYEYKIKHFLVAAALGFTPGTLWNGHFNASGGIIVVKDDGDVVCIHYYDRQYLEDYLYEHSYFETPSMNRHLFGEIYNINGHNYIKLNLQVRFNQ